MKVRTRLLAVAASLGAAAVAATPLVAQATYDIDAYVFVNVPVNSNGSVTVGPVTVTWTISIPVTACSYFSLDDADPIIPEAGIAGGGCTGTGVWTYAQIGCGTGTLTGNMTMTDGGDTRSLTVTGLMTGFGATLAGTTSGLGVVTGHIQLVPNGTQTCVSGITGFTADGNLALAGN
ncbi:MAG TPA: hypothetical protein VN193_17535 [Candidatus Angelobacter sp.]|jgi:hypothetical protein|nr:hypothetical protein [Candidatus Angelobacter sp.]